jgi:hypothetical protein
MEDIDIIRKLSHPIYEARGWMKFIGILAIISGISAIFSLVGILICWLPIWMGILLFQAGNRIENAQLDGNEEGFLESMKKIKTYFMINGIILLIGVVITILVIIFAGSELFSSFSEYAY